MFEKGRYIVVLDSSPSRFFKAKTCYKVAETSGTLIVEKDSKGFERSKAHHVTYGMSHSWREARSAEIMEYEKHNTPFCTLDLEQKLANTLKEGDEVIISSKHPIIGLRNHKGILTRIDYLRDQYTVQGIDVPLPSFFITKELNPEETPKVKEMFETGDYVVIFISSEADSYSKYHCYKQIKSAPWLISVLDSAGHSHSGWDVIRFEDISNWRYATEKEIAEYDRLDKPFDVTKFQNNCVLYEGNKAGNVGVHVKSGTDPLPELLLAEREKLFNQYYIGIDPYKANGTGSYSIGNLLSKDHHLLIGTSGPATADVDLVMLFEAPENYPMSPEDCFKRVESDTLHLFTKKNKKCPK